MEIGQLRESEVQHHGQSEELCIIERITGTGTSFYTKQSGRLREESAASTSPKEEGTERQLGRGRATTDSVEQQTEVLIQSLTCVTSRERPDSLTIYPKPVPQNVAFARQWRRSDLDPQHVCASLPEFPTAWTTLCEDRFSAPKGAMSTQQTQTS